MEAPTDSPASAPFSTPRSDAGTLDTGPVSRLPATRTDDMNQPYHVRPYRPADRAALEAMYEDFRPKRAAQGLPPAGGERIRRWLERTLGRGLHVVVEVEGRVLGHAMLIPAGDDGVELANFLHQSVRGRGIGTELNHITVGLARQHGYRRVWLSVKPSNRAAVRSYQNAGFRPLVGASASGREIEMEVVL